MKHLLLAALLMPINSFAAYLDSHNLTVNQISVWGDTGHLLLQTSPRHAINGLNCSSDYWLTLKKDDDGYQSMLSMLMAAQLSGKQISVRAVDDTGTDYCRLQRVITYQ